MAATLGLDPSVLSQLDTVLRALILHIPPGDALPQELASPIEDALAGKCAPISYQILERELNVAAAGIEGGGPAPLLKSDDIST